MKPLIGINLDIEVGPPPVASVQTTYTDAIIKAGGIPVLLPPLSPEDLNQALDRLQGLLLIGGDDYCPSTYGEQACSKVQLINKTRQDFDFLLIKKALDRKELPILGLCNGLQLLNIALGGSLIQDIEPSHIKHVSVDGWKNGFNKHKVVFTPDSLLQDIYGTSEFSVVTSHHQAIKKLGKGLEVVAHAEDNIVEAVELDGHDFVIGVQWHPERDYNNNETLFKAFVQASAHNNKPQLKEEKSKV